MNRWRMTFSGFWLAWLLMANFAVAATNDFSLGLELCKSGQYPEAAAAFARAARQQPAVGTLLNLGLAEWQRGHAGAAILAWEQAQWIAPNDAQVKANLEFARHVAQVDAPELKWYESASTWLSADAWLWLAGTSLWVTLGLLVLPGIFRRRIRGWQQTLAALSFGIFLASLTANVGILSRTDIGFVVKRNVPLRLTPTREGEVLSTLASGEPARLMRSQGNYLLIRTTNGQGWVDREEFHLISEN